VFSLGAIDADKGRARGSKITVAKIEGYLRAALAEIQGTDE